MTKIPLELKVYSEVIFHFKFKSLEGAKCLETGEAKSFHSQV